MQFHASLPFTLIAFALGGHHLELSAVTRPSEDFNYAAAVVGYTPGAGHAVGYDQPEAALGEPSRLTPGEFGGAVDPFNPPWQPSQLVSLGAGGSLTVRFDLPIGDLPGNAYGLDFLVFGSTGFVIVNGDYSGGGITDGSLFADNAGGASRVSVSADGATYFLLDPALAPGLDGWFPTDGQGDFRWPVDPALQPEDFADRTLAGIRSLYAGSGGGVGYDLAWARDAEGRPVALERIEYVRIEVLAGRAEIDGFTAVPEPGTTVLLLLGLGLPGLLGTNASMRRMRERTAR